MMNFLCCSITVCKNFCQFTWLNDCELLFPVPSGAFLASRQWDELFILLFLLSSLGSTISQQQWYKLFAYLFENIIFEKANKNALQIRLRRRHRKFLRRRRARIARDSINAVTRVKNRKILREYLRSTSNLQGIGWDLHPCQKMFILTLLFSNSNHDNLPALLFPVLPCSALHE